MKQRVILICIAIILVVVPAGCGGNGVAPTLNTSAPNVDSSELDGKWRSSHDGGIIMLEFQGNNLFTHYLLSRGTFSIHEESIEFVNDRTGHIMTHSFSRTENTITIAGNRYNRINGNNSVDGLEGWWELSHGGGTGTLEFQGNNFKSYYLSLRETFLIYEDTIELTSDRTDHIEIYSFSHTEDTITLDGQRYYRVR